MNLRRAQRRSDGSGQAADVESTEHVPMPPGSASIHRESSQPTQRHEQASRIAARKQRAVGNPMYVRSATQTWSRRSIARSFAPYWDDVGLEARTAAVHQTLHRQWRIGMVLGPPKTDRSRRPVRLAAGKVAALRKHLIRQREEALASGGMSHFWLADGQKVVSGQGVEP